MPPPAPAPNTLWRVARVSAGRPVRGAGAIVLAYHDVRPTPGGYHVTPEQLAAHVTLVRSAGLRIIPLDALVDAFLAAEDIDDLAAVSFDDALLGVAELGAPVLERLHCPATVFAVARMPATELDWTVGEQRTLSEAELQALAQRPGITIGSHASTHPSLPTLGVEALADELRGSRHTLAELLGRPVDLLAYPFGHHDDQVRSAARSAGYRAAFTFLNGRVELGQDAFRLPRLTMGAHHTRVRLAYHLGRAASSWPDTQRAEVR
jgi:peptidoglycan/xylan/chitin deacetylase (PgdA/CDA1 family)